jgi:hypothetical protein
MRLARFRFLIVPLLFVFACVGARAQQNLEIVGTVTDQTGAVVPGAALTLTQTETGFAYNTVSTGNGGYSFPGLNIGTYNLKVNAKGFESYSANGLVLNVSQTLAYDVKLTIGAETVSVSVTADALQVQADSNTVSTLINSEQVTEIATENRNFAALAALGLGVSSALPDSNTPTSVASNFTLSVNGLRESHNIWLIDGGEADDRGGAGGMDIMPSQDAIAQFEMLSSNYPPDYGISSGATMSLALKSGTQKFHGELFEFNRNTDYDANDFFNKYNGSTSPRQVLNYNIYGFNIGGPLYIPKVYNTNKQKTFFFWNEEWRKINQGNPPNIVNTLPTADIPTAGTDLTYVAPGFANTDPTSGAVGGILVPRTTDPTYLATLTGLGLTSGSPFPGNVIPHQLFDANAVTYLNLGILPKPTESNGQAASSAQTPITVRDDVVRIDHKINDKWQILGHYIHDSVTQAYGQPMLGWSSSSYNTILSTLSNPSNSAAIKLSATISPNLLVEASMNYDGNIINIVNSKNSLQPSGWGVTPFFNNGRTSLPGIAPFGAPYGTNEDTGSAPWHNAAEDYEPKVDVSYTFGKHQTKYGFSYNRYTKNQQIFGDGQGVFSFAGDSNTYQYTGNKNLTACQGSPVPANCVIGDGIMDMLLGFAHSYSQFQQTPIRHYVNQTPSAYAMDNWKVSPRLSLQLGVRYDALPHAWERANQVSNFDPDAYQPGLVPVWNADGSLLSTGPGFTNYTVSGVTSPYYLNGIQEAGQNGFPRGLVTNYYDTIQPRVGFSMDMFGNGKTVLRGGFGTFYERMQGNDIYNVATNEPFANNPGSTQVFFSTPSVSNQTGATAAAPTFAQGLTDLARDYPAPAVAQYSLGVQHELAPSVIWVVQYVGNLAWHQNIDRAINTFPLTTPLTVREAGGSVTSYVNSNGATVTLPTSGVGPVANASDSWRTYAGFQGINQQENTTNGGYNGFQTGVRLQNRWGLSGELDYTWSHEIDITSYDLNGVSNPWYLKYDRASGALDRRQMLNANYIYHLPFLNKGKGILQTIAGGWTVAGTAIFESGQPQVVTFGGGDTIGLGGGYTNRPTLTGAISYPKKVAEWFNTGVFASPTAPWNGGLGLGFGNTGRDAVVGPGRVNFTTSLYKSFAFGERAHFELRGESFNTFNHSEFNGLNLSYSPGATTFGQVTSDWGPRVLELGGKFVF